MNTAGDCTPAVRIGPGGAFDRDETGASLPDRTDRSDGSYRSDGCDPRGRAPASLGELLFNLRMGRGLACDQVAFAAGLPMQTVLRAEAMNDPVGSIADRVLAALDVARRLTVAELCWYFRLAGLFDRTHLHRTLRILRTAGPTRQERAIVEAAERNAAWTDRAIAGFEEANQNIARAQELCRQGHVARIEAHLDAAVAAGGVC